MEVQNIGTLSEVCASLLDNVTIHSLLGGVLPLATCCTSDSSLTSKFDMALTCVLGIICQCISARNGGISFGATLFVLNQLLTLVNLRRCCFGGVRSRFEIDIVGHASDEDS